MGTPRAFTAVGASTPTGFLRPDGETAAEKHDRLVGHIDGVLASIDDLLVSPADRALLAARRAA